VDEIDAAITAWTVQRPVAEVVATLQAVSVPVGRIYTVQDIAEDPHYRARGMIERIVTATGQVLEVPGIVPKLSATPGAIRTLAPGLGETDPPAARRQSRDTRPERRGPGAALRVSPLLQRCAHASVLRLAGPPPPGRPALVFALALAGLQATAAPSNPPPPWPRRCRRPCPRWPTPPGPPR
jgi:hypothetical protein